MPEPLLEPDPSVRARMSRQRSRDTEPEVALRRILHARGLRFRLHRAVPGRPRRTIDIAFPSEQLAVFVDGCFWHGCPTHGTSPARNGAWWEEKLANNVARDRDTDQVLLDAGWAVVRVWEHEDPAGVAERLQAQLVALRERRG